MKPEDLFAHQCRVNGNYHFDKCAITTCKNYSGIVPSRCLLIDRKDSLNSERGMSDQEIRIFKQYPSVKQVVRNRKRAFNDVYAILILDKYIDYIQQQKPAVVCKTLLEDKQIANMLTKYPFNIPEFSFTPSLLLSLFDEAVYSAFSVRTCKICNEFSLADILGLDQQVLVATLAKIKTFERSTL